MTRRFIAGTLIALATTPVLAPRAWAQPAAIAGAGSGGAGAPVAPAPGNPPPMLAPTNHPRVSTDVSHLWLAPDQKSNRSASALANALTLFRNHRDSEALAALSQSSVQEGVLGHYALYYAGRTQAQLGRHLDALRTYRLLLQRQVVGYLKEIGRAHV